MNIIVFYQYTFDDIFTLEVGKLNTLQIVN